MKMNDEIDYFHSIQYYVTMLKHVNDQNRIHLMTEKRIHRMRDMCREGIRTKLKSDVKDMI